MTAFGVCPFRLNGDEWVPLAVEENGECGWMQAELEEEDGPVLHLVKERTIARHELRGGMIRLSPDDDEVIHFYELEGDTVPLALQFVTRDDAEEANRRIIRILEARERLADTAKAHLEQQGFASKDIVLARQVLGKDASSRDLLGWIFDNVVEEKENADGSSTSVVREEAASAEQLVAEWAAKQGFPEPDDPALESKIDEAEAWSIYSGASPTAASSKSPGGFASSPRATSSSPRRSRRKPPPPPKRPAPSNSQEEERPPSPPTLQQLRAATEQRPSKQQQQKTPQRVLPPEVREERQRRRRPPPPKSPPREEQRRKRVEDATIEKEVTKEAQRAIEAMSLKQEEEDEEEWVSPVDFVPVRRLGSGAFSTVILVRKEDGGSLYAMKVMEKQAILKAGLAHAVQIEREVLRVVRHSFLVQLRYAFQTPRKIYLLTDFYAAGSLDDALRSTNRRGLGVDVARFVSAELALALSHLHAQAILHRDVKAANVLLDAKGHAHLADYGLAKVMDKKKQQKKKLSFAGTLEYMAPEFIAKKAKVVGAASDWWALGCLLAETAQGFTPFRADTPRQLMANIIKGEPRIDLDQIRHVMSDLLQRDPNLRLSDIRKVALHPFFQSIDFPTLAEKKIEPPFSPPLASVAPDNNIKNIFKEHYLEFFQQSGDEQTPRRRPKRKGAEPPADFNRRRDDLAFLGFSYPFQQ